MLLGGAQAPTGGQSEASISPLLTRHQTQPLPHPPFQVINFSEKKMLFVFFPGKILIMGLMCLSSFCVLRGFSVLVAAKAARRTPHTRAHAHTHRHAHTAAPRPHPGRPHSSAETWLGVGRGGFDRSPAGWRSPPKPPPPPPQSQQLAAPPTPMGRCNLPGEPVFLAAPG